MIETYSFDAEAVYDDTGTDYLYTRFSMVVRAVVNGQARVDLSLNNGPFISYGFGSNRLPVPATRRPEATTVPGGPGMAPPAGAGVRVGGFAGGLIRGIVHAANEPLVTHEVVRHRLETPRGTLVVFSGPGMETGRPFPGSAGAAAVPGAPAVVTLVSPLPGFECDAKNGPSPRVLGVHTAVGDARTLLVDWSCETFVNEATLNGVFPSGALLSNRFSQVHLVDDHGYTIIGTEGVAIFRTDLLFPVGPAAVNPDAIRSSLFMPIPNGFVREKIQVQGIPDVTGVQYSYQDRQVPVNFVAGPFAKAASISAVHRQAVTSNADVAGGVLNAYERWLGVKANRNFAKHDAGGGDAKLGVGGILALRRLLGVRGGPRRARPVPPGGGP